MYLRKLLADAHLIECHIDNRELNNSNFLQMFIRNIITSSVVKCN